MNIRWRLAVVAVQIAVLVMATFWAIEKPFSISTWFAAGLLSIVINSQILEPFYPRPADVIGNTVICFLLYLTTTKVVAQFAWNSFAIFLITVFALAIFSSWFGAGRKQGKLSNLAQKAKDISTEATAVRIYSILFWLSLIESYPKLDEAFWKMGVAWAILIVIGLINWQKILGGKTRDCSVEGGIAPSRIFVSTSELPGPGSWINLYTKESIIQGSVISRISRADDVWGQIYLDNQQDYEKLLKLKNTSFEIVSQTDNNVLGIADEGSTQRNLVFCPERPLEIGKVVSVKNRDTEILFQIHSAKIQQFDIRNGSVLQTQAIAKQLGTFNLESLRMNQYSWVPNPGTAVRISNLEAKIDQTKIPPSWMLIGHIKGTDLPIYLDINSVCEGHMVILGMTKMGKTTLAFRLASCLSKVRQVTIFDQTCEYRTKRNVPEYTQQHDNASTGIAVWEPKLNAAENIVTKAYERLSSITNLSRTLYNNGTLIPKTILIEEAHQFIPEPQGLSFGKEKDDTQRTGALLMQIRKFGISVILISQRTAVVAKSAISQCENIIAFKSVDRTGLDYLDTVSGQEISEVVPLLQQGEAIVFGPAFSCDVPVVIEVLNEKTSPTQSSQNVQALQEIVNSNIPSTNGQELETSEEEIPF